MSPLSTKRRSELRAEAHKLTPVVIIGDKGLTDTVVAEIDRSLKAHELVKVRAASGERDVRDTWLETICQRLQAHSVQQIGKVFVLYRENPEEKPAPGPSARGDGRKGGARKAEVLTALGKERQRARDAEKRKQRDVEDMVRKGKIPANKLKSGRGPGYPTAGVTKPRGGARDDEPKTGPWAKSGPRANLGSDRSVDPDATRTSRPRSRTPSPPLESAPRRRRPRTSR